MLTSSKPVEVSLSKTLDSDQLQGCRSAANLDLLMERGGRKKKQIPLQESKQNVIMDTTTDILHIL